MKKNKKKTSKFALWPPALVSTQDHIFDSADHALDAMDAIISLINKKYRNKKNNGKPSLPAFFVENLEIRFDSRYRRLRIEAGICDSTIFIVIPRSDLQQDEDLKSLEIHYGVAFGPIIKEMQLRVGLQYFRSLEPEPQEKLISQYLRSRRK